MTDRTADLLYFSLILILPLSALIARRVPMKNTLKMAVAWVAIFVALFLLVVGWQRVTGLGTQLGLFFQ
jgi:aspartyl protease family protein